MIYFICIEHEKCERQMTWEEYVNDDSDHTWIGVS